MTAAENVHGRFVSLDFLRLFSALAVVLFHFGFRGSVAPDANLAAGYPEIAAMAIYGYLGVNLFFLISGFVISWSAEGRDFASFAIARFARLYPGYATCMSLTALVVFMFGAAPLSVTWPQYTANLTMFAPALGQPFMDGVYWTIVLEIVFYAWVALALLAGIFERWKLPLMAAWLALAMLNEFAVGSGALRLLFITQYAPFFIGGVLLQHMAARGATAEAAILAIAAFVASANSLVSVRDWMLDAYGTAAPLPSLMIANTIIHLLMIGAVLLSRHIRPQAWMIAAGALTYPLYLLHQHIGYIALNHLTPITGRWLALSTAVAGLVWLSWLVARHVEQPARRFIVGQLGAVVRSAATYRTRRAPAA